MKPLLTAHVNQVALIFPKAVFYACLMVFLCFSNFLLANEPTSPDFQLLKERKFSGSTPLISQNILGKISEIQKNINEQKNTKATELLNAALSETNQLRPYEQAQLLNLRAYLNYSAGNYAAAIVDYQKILQSKELTASLFNDSLYALAQLYYLSDDLAKAVSFMDVWLARNPKPGVSAYEFLAQLYYHQKKFSEAILSIEKALKLYQEQNRTPNENTYRLLMALHYEQKNLQQVERILRLLLAAYPKREYWMQLAAVYGLQNKTMQQLSTLDLAYVQNFLETENEYLTLAYLYINASVPYKAAKLLDEGFKKEIISESAQHRSLLANAWSLARELDEAIVEMEKAATLSEAGDLYFRLGQIYLSAELYQKAEQAFNNALKKELENKTLVYTYLAIVYVQLQQWEQAQAAFEKAEQDEKNREVLEQWRLYMKNSRKQS